MGNTLVHGIDCTRLGSTYASALLGNAQVRIEDMLTLQMHPKYKKLKDDQRRAVHENIRFAAKGMLLAAGYKPAVVEQVMTGK